LEEGRTTKRARRTKGEKMRRGLGWEWEFRVIRGSLYDACSRWGGGLDGDCARRAGFWSFPPRSSVVSLPHVTVKPPALYRSPLFWLGTFVLVFLVWVWADSMRAGTSATRGLVLEGARKPGQVTPERAYFHDGMNLNAGRIVLAFTRVTNPQPHVTVRYDPGIFFRFPAGPRWSLRPIDPESHEVGMKLATVRYYRVDVPMWGIVASYLGFAAVVIAWRRRRWRRTEGGFY
jgi:hypothetical protein